MTIRDNPARLPERYFVGYVQKHKSAIDIFTPCVGGRPELYEYAVDNQLGEVINAKSRFLTLPIRREAVSQL